VCVCVYVCRPLVAESYVGLVFASSPADGPASPVAVTLCDPTHTTLQADISTASLVITPQHKENQTSTATATHTAFWLVNPKNGDVYESIILKYISHSPFRALLFNHYSRRQEKCTLTYSMERNAYLYCTVLS
jgi:hypothetical protein